MTGGAGFIGSALIRHLISHTNDCVLNLDKLTYAGNVESLRSVEAVDRYQFLQADICDEEALKEAFEAFKPTIVVHLAAESHVDRSIDAPDDFIQTNIVGTYRLLGVALDYFLSLPSDTATRFRFHHVSTDEVYGDLKDGEGLFTEATPYAPSSPYSASKAASDHLVRAWSRTYGLPVVMTNCSNNYGPYQFPEKLIPHTLLNALGGKPIPVYGAGDQIRDWLYVDDHACALERVARRGSPGETYNIGGWNEQTNLCVVTTICDLLMELRPPAEATVSHYRDLITSVADRPGHDKRYAIDATKMDADLDWAPRETFTTGLRKTVQWYLDNPDWWQRVLDGSYQLERAGLAMVTKQ